MLAKLWIGLHYAYNKLRITAKKEMNVAFTGL